MRAEPTFAHEWPSFQKTIVVDHPSWFLEPSVYAGKSAAGFFPFEALCANHLNVRFYQQLPYHGSHDVARRHIYSSSGGLYQ